MKTQFKQWYNEYHGNIRIHDFVSIMINQFPIFVIRRYDNPHSGGDFSYVIYFGILGYTFIWSKNTDDEEEKEYNFTLNGYENKTSLDYSKSIQGTFGSFNKKFGPLRSLEYLDKLIAADRYNELDIEMVGKMYHILENASADLYEVSNIEKLSTKKLAFGLFKEYHISQINKLDLQDNNIKSTMENYIITTIRILNKF